MRLLLDTHVLLWALVSPQRIPARVRRRLESPEHEVLFSAASIWEIAIKVQIGRMALPMPVEEVAAAAVHSGFEELPIRAAHAAATVQLPLHHRDPFDRLLIAQALYEPARLLTVDRRLAPYSDLVEVLG
ncbi:MAG: type II toxin-antitoxin system VapC family toxin [Armatimonadota bacterium]|nr:type II toxin-antitoxin system VapC family toxin [Armatimonadota bacterium]